MRYGQKVREGRVFRYVRDDDFKLSSGVNWSVCSIKYCSVARDNSKDGCWFLIQRVQDSGPDIQGKRAVIWICLAHSRRRYKGGVCRRRGILLGVNGDLRERNRGKLRNN